MLSISFNGHLDQDELPECSTCGGPLESNNSTDTCWRCTTLRHRGDSETLQRYEEERREAKEKAEAERALKESLGLPPDAQLRTFTVYGHPYGPEWTGYALHMRGIPAGCESWPPPWPYFRLGPFLTQVWLRCVFCENSAAFVEARWHPEWGESIMLRGLEDVRRVGDAQRALKGLKLLRLMDKQGRQENSGYFRSPDEFHAQYRAALEQLAHQGVRHPSAQLVADTMGIGRSTLFSCRQKFGDSTRSE